MGIRPFAVTVTLVGVALCAIYSGGEDDQLNSMLERCGSAGLQQVYGDDVVTARFFGVDANVSKAGECAEDVRHASRLYRQAIVTVDVSGVCTVHEYRDTSIMVASDYEVWETPVTSGTRLVVEKNNRSLTDVVVSNSSGADCKLEDETAP